MNPVDDAEQKTMLLEIDINAVQKLYWSHGWKRLKIGLEAPMKDAGFLIVRYIESFWHLSQKGGGGGLEWLNYEA